MLSNRAIGMAAILSVCILPGHSRRSTPWQRRRSAG